MGDGLSSGPLLPQGVGHRGGRLRVREGGGGQGLSPHITDHKAGGGMQQVKVVCITVELLMR